MSSLEVNSSAYTLFDRDLSGGIRFVDSPRHRSYVDGRAFRKELDRVSDRIGWQPLAPGMFAVLRDGRPAE